MYTYIVVDDEPLTRRGTIKKIGNLDHKVTCIGEASNGEEALLLIHKLDPNIIITDMNMPILDGIGLLQQLCKKYPDKQIIVISGYKDFEYAKQAIAARATEYILKPFNREAIQTAMINAINLIENKTELQDRIISSEAEKEYAKHDYDIHVLKNLILGYHTTTPELVSDKLKLIKQNHHFILMTLHSTTKIEEAPLTELIQAHGFSDLSLYLPHLHNNQMSFFILFFPKRTPLELDSICCQLSLSFISVLKCEHHSISIGISSTKAELLQLNTAFKETVSALNSKKISEINNYYLYDEEVPFLSSFYWEHGNEFLFRIETGETERVITLIDDLFNYFTTHTQYTLYELKYHCIQLMEKARDLLAYYFNNTSQNSNSTTIQNIFNSLFTFEEIKTYFLQFFTNISLSMQSKNVYATGDVIENVKIYVQRNYSNDLNLEFISSLFYINRSYFSHLFKKRSNISFVDYVNTIRIDKAKLLLRDSDKKMYQIAKSVGYENVKYFFRIFKKTTGVTPEQYRQV